jgi:hypothetical protein
MNGVICGLFKPKRSCRKMIEKESKKNKSKSRKRSLIFFVVFVFLWITFLGFAGIYGSSDMDVVKGSFSKSRVLGEKDESRDQGRVIAQANLEEDVEEADANEEDEGEEVEMVNDAALKSESYSVSQIRFGTAVALDSGALGSVPLEISSISGEVLVSGEDQEPRFLIAWKTNKDAKSEVTYSKGDGEDVQYFQEENYGFDHSVLLSDIELSTIYAYNIKARDKWGNEVASEYFSIYTGDKQESIFDLIIAAIENTFGWAMNR